MVVLLAAIPCTAYADHHHDGGYHDARADDAVSSYGVAVQLTAARFATMSYIGDYQAVTPSLQWTRGRFGASVNLGLYRLYENGRRVHGIGDATVVMTTSLLRGNAANLGLALATSLPTGNQLGGLGHGARDGHARRVGELEAGKLDGRGLGRVWACDRR